MKLKLLAETYALKKAEAPDPAEDWLAGYQYCEAKKSEEIMAFFDEHYGKPLDDVLFKKLFGIERY